jgi:heme-degrading monooxygenase HmoA
MIEVHKTFTLYPNVDPTALKAYTKRAIGVLLQAPGVVEVRAYRNLLGAPQVRLVVAWETLADWAAFAESDIRRAYDSELATFATDIRIELWGPSPNVPEPLRPRH